MATIVEERALLVLIQAPDTLLRDLRVVTRALARQPAEMEVLPILKGQTAAAEDLQLLDTETITKPKRLRLPKILLFTSM